MGTSGVLVHNSYDDLVTVYHFTDAKGAKAIASGKNITFKANTPPAGNPRGAYFSKLGPDEFVNKSISATLSIPHRKTKYVFEIRISRKLLKEKGGMHRSIAFSPTDVNIAEGFWRLFENPNF